MSRYYRSILNVQAVTPSFLPTDIAGCELWLDASDASTISIGTGVSQWNDKSGNARHAVQGTAASQPAYTLAGINGLNVVQFAGSQKMENSTMPIFSATTIFFAGKANNLFGGEIIQLRRRDPSNTFRFVAREIVLGVSNFVMGDTAVNNVTVTTPTGINYQLPHINTYTKTGAATPVLTFKHNNTLFALTGSITGPDSTNTGYDLGVIHLAGGSYTNFYTGLMGEVIVYNSVLSSGDQLLVYNYLSTKWAI